MKRGIKVGDAMIYDMEALFSRLLIVGQNRNTSLVSVFEYELCAVPSSIFDEFGLYCEKNWPSFQLSPVLQMKWSWIEDSYCISSHKYGDQIEELQCNSY